jgi:hypothetical protein
MWSGQARMKNGTPMTIAGELDHLRYASEKALVKQFTDEIIQKLLAARTDANALLTDETIHVLQNRIVPEEHHVGVIVDVLGVKVILNTPVCSAVKTCGEGSTIVDLMFGERADGAGVYKGHWRIML